MSTSLVDLLRDHIGHRTTIVEPTPTRSLSLRCIDCTRLIDLSSALGLRPSSLTPTSTSQPLHLNDPTACPQHPGQRASHCGPCRSERLAGDAA